MTNELFLYLSANGYNRFGDQSYLENAKKVSSVFFDAPMTNFCCRHGIGVTASRPCRYYHLTSLYSKELGNEELGRAMERRVNCCHLHIFTCLILLSLTDDCKNNGQTTWIYNQGVIASGLAQLYIATGNASLLDEAELTLDATIAHKTQNGILKESCDDVAHSTCNQDQAMFKGIWMKHLQYYLDAVPGSVSKYASFIGAQESAVVHYATGEGYAIENVWYGASQVCVDVPRALCTHESCRVAPLFRLSRR